MKELFITLSVLLLIGCSLTPPQSSPVAIYDLGLQQTDTDQVTEHASSKALSLLITEVAAPAWLNNQAIHYRLAYHNPAQLYAYANSRWAASPAALLTRQIDNRIKTDTDYQVISTMDGIHAEYALHSTLEDFSQIFDTADNSHAIVLLHVNLIKRSTRSIRAQRRFKIQTTAASADASGAVHALIKASNQLNDEIIAWLNKELTKD